MLISDNYILERKSDTKYFCKECHQYLFSTKNKFLKFPNRVVDLETNEKEYYFKCPRCKKQIHVILKNK